MNKQRPFNPRKEGGRFLQTQEAQTMRTIKSIIAAAAIAVGIVFSATAPARAAIPGNSDAFELRVATKNVAAAGYTALVPASGSLAWVVLGYQVNCTNAATTAIAFCQSNNAAANVITSTKTVAANGGNLQMDPQPFSIFTTSAGAALGINLGNAGPCGVDIQYTYK